MFADVTGFTSMSDKLDPEDVHQIMNGCFSILMDEVHKCEGTVNEFRGDGVMALFGAPIAHEDHAQRACYAALSIQKGLVPYGEKLKKDYGIDFKMRIGLNSGPVVVGVIGDDLRMDYTAQGDTANLAARMETNADPGTVLVAKQTYRLTKDVFEYEQLGKIQVKGKETAVEAYRLKDTASRLRPRPVREVYSDMIGRDQELSRLELQILKAVNGEGSVINVIGEAGIGKSRLMAELKKREVVKRVSFLEGRAISTGKNLSFHPIIDLLKNWALIREDDKEPAAVKKLETAIRRVSVEEADEILPFVATLMGMKLSGKHAERIKGVQGESLDKIIFKNVRDLLIRSTEIIPLVIVMEDLHWADTSSRLILDSLYRLAMTQKVVFINVFRPGYWDGDDPTVETLKARLPDLSVVEIVIRPLDLESSQALINNMLNVKGLHHDVKRQIIERAGGNPFFIEEVVRSLIDEGALVVTDDGFEVTDKINSVVIPPTIQDVLMARIDRLDEESRSLVKVASVIGRSFFYRILAEVVSRADHLGERLEYLKETQLIRERTRMEELEYLFKHALAQEAVYESTLIQQRKELHLKVAQSIEKLFQERLHEFYGMLAYHYGKGEDPEKAEEYMTKAGEEALRSSASSEALEYFREAMKLYVGRYGQKADPQKIIAFKQNLALAHFNRGQFSEALPYLDEILEGKGFGHPRTKLGLVVRAVADIIGIATFFYAPVQRKMIVPNQKFIEDMELIYAKMKCLYSVDHRRFFVEALSAARLGTHYDLSRHPQRIEWPAAWGIVFFAVGLNSLGTKWLKHAEGMIPDEDGRGLLTLKASRQRVACNMGLWDSVPGFDPSLVDVGLKNGEHVMGVQYILTLGIFKAERGLFDDTKPMAGKLERIAESYDYNHARIAAHLLQAVISLGTGGLQHALASADEGRLMTDRAGYEPWKLTFLGFKALTEARLGHTEAALSTVNEGELLLARLGTVLPFFLTPFLLAKLQSCLQILKVSVRGGSRSDVLQSRKTAYRTARQAVHLSRKYAPYRTWILRLMGDYYWLIGKQRKALKWFDKSIKEGERLGARPDLSRTYMEVGKRLLEPHSKYSELNGLDAKAYLEKAEALFREMDLEWDLEQLDEIRSRM